MFGAHSLKTNQTVRQGDILDFSYMTAPCTCGSDSFLALFVFFKSTTNTSSRKLSLEYNVGGHICAYRQTQGMSSIQLPPVLLTLSSFPFCCQK